MAGISRRQCATTTAPAIGFFVSDSTTRPRYGPRLPLRYRPQDSNSAAAVETAVTKNNAKTKTTSLYSKRGLIRLTEKPPPPLRLLASGGPDRSCPRSAHQ